MSYTQQSTVDFPHYRLQVNSNGGGSATVIISFAQNDGTLLSGLTPDQFADLLRDHVAAQSGYSSSSLDKLEVTSTAL